MRLRLHIQAPDLAGLPWEYLYDPGQDEFLCLSHSTSVVRYPELAEPLQPLQVTPPLRILGMIASPSDQDRLDIKREQARMEEALKTLNASGQIELTWLAGQTWEDLQEAMWHGPWHIFHFIGHGGYDKRADEGVIAFCDEEGQAHLLGARDLARLLTGHRPLRLVVLNACDGAKGGSRDLFSSTAATLAKRGIPAVLAMQEEITDKAAIQLTRTFYRALANGQPVDAALDDARTAMSVALRHSLEWGTPVLYLRAPDSTLFTLGSTPPPAPARTPEAPLAQTEPAPPVTRAAQPEAPAPPPSPAKTKEQWVEEGEQHRTAGRNQAALECFEQAITMDPSYVLAIRGQSTLFNLKRYEEALKAADEAIQRHPSDAAAHYNKGYFLSSLQRYQEALPAFDEAIKRNPQFGWAYTSKGQALAALGRYVEAVAALEQALQLNPNDSATRQALQRVPVGTELLALASVTMNSVAWSPDGRRLASASKHVEENVRLWDAASGQAHATLRGHTDVVQSVAWSPDGRRLASASNDSTIKDWLQNSDNELWEKARIASARSDKTLQVWWVGEG